MLVTTTRSETYLEELIGDFDSDNEENPAVASGSSLSPVSIPVIKRSVSNQEIYVKSFFSSNIIVLPVEILTELAIRYLGIHEIRSLMNVCKLWNQIFRRDEIWRGLFQSYINRNIHSDPQSSSPHNCVHHQDEGFCLLCGQELLPSSSDHGFVVISSPQQLAQLLSAERKRVELMEMNRLGEDSPLRTPTKVPSQTIKVEVKPEWNLHIAIPSSFLSPNSSNKLPLQGSIHCALEEDYSDLPQGKWYFRYKQHHNERFCSRSWKSLSESWKWLRSILRDQLYIAWKLSFSQFQSFHLPISASTVTRASAKLTSVSWIRFYETIKEEMKLQADALTRDIVHTYSVLLLDSSTSHLSLVKYTCEICQLFISWCSELESLLIPLNCKIADDQETDLCVSSERYQRCKRDREGESIPPSVDCYTTNSQRTPHIEDLCCLILRSRCLLHWEISSTLKHSIQILCNDLEERNMMIAQHQSADLPEESLTAILKLYALIQSLDVPDDTSCSHFRFDHEMNQHLSSSHIHTRNIFRSCYHNFFMTQHILLPHIRSFDRLKKDEMMKLNQW
jgi:hypothetical protein